jgi:hypothetical protein
MFSTAVATDEIGRKCNLSLYISGIMKLTLIKLNIAINTENEEVDMRNI